MYLEPDAFVHQVVGGRWRLLQVLGPTEHGATYRAETLEDGRAVRLELWDPRHVEPRGEMARFEREARTLSHLRHERCLSVVAFGAHEGRPFLVSDLPEANTLRDELGAGDLTVSRALALGLQLCEGLRHLHGHGVVHRALLPENIWISRAGAAELLKIGLPRIGHTTGPVATPRERFYLPPGRPGSRPDHRADLYAAGMLLYVMCTGREPADELFAAIAGGAAVPPPRAVAPEREISEGLERVILRAIAPVPEVRFSTADDLLTALQTAGARVPAPKRAVQRPRPRTAMIAAALATVAVLAGVALRSSGGQAPSEEPMAAEPPAPPPRVLAKAPVAPPPAPTPAVAVQPKPPAAPAPVPERNPPAAPAIEPKVLPAPALASEPKPAPAVAVAVAAPRPEAPPAAAVSASSADGERREIWSLLDSGRLDEGGNRIKALVARDPDAAWPRFALGVFYYRKYWRRDAVRQWQQALEEDPEIRNDPQFGAYLCFMLDDEWQAAGMADLLGRLRAKAVPLLQNCAATAKTPRLRAQAARTLHQFDASRR